MTTAEQEYQVLLEPYLAPGFSFREIVNGNRTHQMPPRSFWPRIVPAIRFANVLRQRMIDNHGAKGLLVNAAYRPQGGAAQSQHKFNRALDLDLFPSDYELAKEYATEAVRMFCTLGVAESKGGGGMSVGLGLYGRKGSCATIRVHVDIGKPGGSRGWQIVGGNEYGMKKSDIRVIAEREGLVLP